MAADQKYPQNGTRTPEPRGFGERTRGLAGEYAHEQGWGLDVEERTKIAPGPQDLHGGKDYEYGARDFGDEPVDTEIDRQQPNQIDHEPATSQKEDEA